MMHLNHILHFQNRDHCRRWHVRAIHNARWKEWLLETADRGASELTLVITASSIHTKLQGRGNPSMNRTGDTKPTLIARELMTVLNYNAL